MMPISIGEPWMWIAFIGFVITMLALDLFVFGGRKAHRVSVREALAWVVAWASMALIFAALLWWYLYGTLGAEEAQRKTLEFLAGYLIEQSLSVDNMFVFVMIFSYFAVPPELQRRVLLYGVLGAIVMRAIMILAGVWLVSEFAWLLYVFGAFLVVTGIKMLIFAEHEPDLDKNPLLRWLIRHLRVTSGYHGEKFFVRQNGVLWATPMFLVLVLIEASDLVFAIDSIPAIFAVTTDPFIVFTSNIFAIMGLRALYFLLADMANRFHLLKYGLAIVLVFIGGKMLVMPWFHMPIQWSLAIVGSIILVSVVLSLTLVKGKTRAMEKIMNATKDLTVQEPPQTARDSDGRLIGLSVDSGRSILSVVENTWLVAIDGSEHSLRATAQAVYFGLMQNCAIHLINVQPWLSKEAAESELMRRGWDATAKARELLDKSGIPWRLHVVMGETVESIVALADSLGCRGIIIGSKGLNATEALLLGSVAYKVIHLSKVSVLVVR
jgi:tellurite resistance protein TerC